MSTHTRHSQTPEPNRIRVSNIQIVKPSPRSLETEIENLLKSDAATRADMAVALKKLEQEIAERRRAEEALRASEAALKKSQTLFSSLFRDSPAATILSFLEDGRCVDANEAYCRLVGYTRDELVGRTTTELNIWMSPDERKAVVTELTRQGRAEHVELALRAKDGTLCKTVAGGEVLDIDGRRHILSFFFDITERKRAEAERIELERQLLHTQKLESLGVLAGGIAHDFNNLLMAILGNLEMTLMDLPESSGARPGIEQAVLAARRATDLTRQMLAYSGKGRFVVIPMDLNAIVRENAELFRAAMPRTITMDVRLAPEPCVVEADPGQIQQVIMNLITNASEAVARGPGTITLTTGILSCDEAYLRQSRLVERPPPGPFAFLEVADTGCGMNSKTLHHLFDPFFSTKFTGRGLGMAAVLGIVRGHKGAIRVDSTVGRGTTVRVLFPVSTEKLPTAVKDPGPILRKPLPVAGTAQVLVMDDEKDVRTVAAEFLQRLGFQPILASDGEEGLALFKQHAGEFLCVLLDLTMPRMEGVSTFRQMKRLRPDAKVILCSGYSEQEATERFTREGLAGFLQKPYRLQDLKARIERILKRPDPAA